MGVAVTVIVGVFVGVTVLVGVTVGVLVGPGVPVGDAVTDAVGVLVGVVDFGGFFWLWYPVYQASIRNFKYRSYKYGGFFRGRIVDWWITEKVIGKQETVNNRGELVIIENREKRINLEIGDNTGFSIEFDAPLRSTHKAIARGQVAEMLVMSNSADLSTIEEFSNIYIPSRNLWVSDYPYVREDLFNEVSRRIRSSPRGRSQTPKYRAKPQDDYYDDES